MTITAGTSNTGEVGIPMVFTLEPPAAATSNAIREVIVNFGDGTVRNLGSLLARPPSPTPTPAPVSTP